MAIDLHDHRLVLKEMRDILVWMLSYLKKPGNAKDLSLLQDKLALVDDLLSIEEDA